MPQASAGVIELENGHLALIDKPAGVTSHDVVDRVRAISGEKRVGHAGTLDPMATGLLIVGVGRGATRMLADGLEGGKRYLATVRLGLSSETLDAEGESVEVEVPIFDETRIEEALTEIRRQTGQVPPMISALKRFGVAMYKLARRGWWIERTARPAVIDELTLVKTDGRTLVLEIAGGGGLYVRSIARDLGIVLGVPAALTALRRTKVGQWDVSSALTLDEYGTELKQEARR